jgi:hypothetical protein
LLLRAELPPLARSGVEADDVAALVLNGGIDPAAVIHGEVRVLWPGLLSQRTEIAQLSGLRVERENLRVGIHPRIDDPVIIDCE